MMLGLMPKLASSYGAALAAPTRILRNCDVMVWGMITGNSHMGYMAKVITE
ncbi:hypothetical protein ABHF33_15390 [Chitinibacter sp. FCG-7]|uniref:Uncharacterized protein n=1 Tax=Chitinibacter mangrovi TaxID=3153927 RepID=A0AAU7F926_9NEIS